MNSAPGSEQFAPHGVCLAWNPDLMAATVLSNGLIVLAVAIIAFGFLVRASGREPSMPRWFYWSFAVLFFACGMSHVLDVVTLWFPIYWFQVTELMITAFASLFVAMLPLRVWLAREAAGRRR